MIAINLYYNYHLDYTILSLTLAQLILQGITLLTIIIWIWCKSSITKEVERLQRNEKSNNRGRKRDNDHTFRNPIHIHDTAPVTSYMHNTY